MWTVFTTKEFPPEDIKKWEEEKLRNKGLFNGIIEITKGIGGMPKTMLQLAIVQFFTWLAFFYVDIYNSRGCSKRLWHY